MSQNSLLMIDSSLEQILQSLHIHISVQTKLFFLQLHRKYSHPILHLRKHNFTICFERGS